MILNKKDCKNTSNYRSSCRILTKTTGKMSKITSGLVTNLQCTVQFVTALLFSTFFLNSRRLKNEIS